MITDIEPDLDDAFDFAQKTKKRRKNVSNSLLRMEIARSLNANQVTKRLGMCIGLIVEAQVGRKWMTCGYEEIRPDAMMRACDAILKINVLIHKEWNAYGYIVSIVNDSFKRTIERENKQRDIQKLAKEFDMLMKETK